MRLRPRRAPGWLFRISMASIAFLGLDLTSVAQKPKVMAPHRPIHPRLEKRFLWGQPASRQAAVGGLWMTGPDAKSSLALTNGLATDALTVTPIMWLSNGARYPLAPVVLEPHGTAVVDLNAALAAQGIAPYGQLYGYIEIEYQWSWAIVCATVRNVDVKHSLIFMSQLVPTPDRFPDAMAAMNKTGPQNLEGMWWKEEPGVTGFAALSNITGKPIHVSMRVTDIGDATLDSYSLTVSPHGTKMVELSSILSATAKSGGIYLTHDGGAHELVVNGGMEDQATGYSAQVLMLPPPEPAADGNAAPVSDMSFAELGLMSGPADPMMLFPAPTTFTPYSFVRNISEQNATVIPTIWWMEGGQAHSAALASVSVPGHRTVNFDLPALLETANLKNFKGSFNLALDVRGIAGGLLLESGSVDQTKTYVFEVMPRGVTESASKSLSYWSTANGDDTMVTLWNPADEDQDFVFTVFYAGGQYKLPMKLGARATRAFNFSDLVRQQIPDAEGNLIPTGVHEGSAEIAGPNGEQEHILVSMDAGTYNVDKATCGMYCQTCNGFTSLFIVDNPFGMAVGGTKQQTFYMQWNGGTQYNMNNSSTWSSNATSVATVGSAGLVTGVGAGQVTISAFYPGTEPNYIANYCTPGYPPCPVATNPGASGPGGVQKPGFLQVVSTSTDTSFCLGNGCAAILKYKVLDVNNQPMNMAGMSVTESVSGFGGTCGSANLQDSSTWTTDSSGTMTQPDQVYICPIQQQGNCNFTFNQTFTVNGFPVLLLSQSGTTSGSHNAISITVSNGTVSCPRIVITP